MDRDDIGRIGELIASTLSFEIRVLCHIIGRIFLPKIGKFDFMFERELPLMFH